MKNEIDNNDNLKENKIKEKYNQSISQNTIECEPNPNKLKLLKDITKDSYSDEYVDHSFIIFRSINNILYLIYSNKKKSIISYDLINNIKIIEIKNAHKNYITHFSYYNDIMNKRDLFISISSKEDNNIDNNIKLWNISNYECLLEIKNIYRNGDLSACFLSYENNVFILTANYDIHYIGEPIRIYDLFGNKIKEIKNSYRALFFIYYYYDNKLFNTYIIAGYDRNSCESFDFMKNKIYHKYIDINNDNLGCDNIIINNRKKITEMIVLCNDGNIRIWNFHSGELLNQIYVTKIFDPFSGCCLWNNKYLLCGCGDNTIKVIELEKGIVINSLKGHKSHAITIEKIIYTSYGECLISQGAKDDQIKMWIIEN